ncbi:protein decapping 5-like [Gossypium australe]|uniref:Protein decapping 5-like n=1 Tax=Gossypium australe TaxID=47621 RepID=A0A5B6VQ39_9ROSI|nr:protein decapping 5-like [Gossypium australe]
MASTESSRSSTAGSPDSYIGSLISLTSKSEIRYEGVLFNINTEESSIGLRNVRSFGTEGRKKDGPQVPASDKIYEYILFRGSNIKDLQVKSSPPPVQTSAPIHNDPAIIQSHYPQSAIASTSLPSSGSGSMQDMGSQTSSIGLTRPPFQGNLPLYQPGANLGPWGSSAAPTTNNGLSIPMYWQGYYGSANGLPPQQQPLLQPPPGLTMPSSVQQPMQYPAMNASLPAAASNLPGSQLPENTPLLLPPFGTGTLNLQSSGPPAQSSNVASDSLTSLNQDRASALTLPTTAPSSSLPLVPPSSTALDKTAVMLPFSEKTKTVPDPVMPFKGMPDSASSTIGTTSSVLNDGMLPSLVTPGQLLQPGLVPASLSMSSQTAQKDVEVVHVSSPELTTSVPALAPVPAKASQPVLAQAPQSWSAQAAPPLLAQAPQQPSKTEGQEPILPSPSPSDHKVFYMELQCMLINIIIIEEAVKEDEEEEEEEEMRYIFCFFALPDSPKGSGLICLDGLKHMEVMHESICLSDTSISVFPSSISRSATKFTEEFDFTAMNEKFNKDEVWGHLGKSSRAKEDADDLQNEDSVESSQVEVKPLYVKDDFFDSLSCDSLGGGSRNGRTRFSEQMRRDTETFGDIPRHRGGRGGRGPFHGGRARGSYYGRGYGYGGRGRGYGTENRTN